MTFESKSKISQILKKLPLVGYFWEKSFLHYVWVSGLFSLVNIFLLWLLIDVLDIPTILASTVVIGGTFILRYVFFKLTKIV